MYMFSPKELAPVEDQGFMFGIINNAANASADQKSHFGRAAEQVFLSAPERDLDVPASHVAVRPVRRGAGRWRIQRHGGETVGTARRVPSRKSCRTCKPN